MSKKFMEPMYEVVRFDQNDIVTASCQCNVAGMDLGAGSNQSCSIAEGNAPECMCGEDLDQNCAPQS